MEIILKRNVQDCIECPLLDPCNVMKGGYPHESYICRGHIKRNSIQLPLIDKTTANPPSKWMMRMLSECPCATWSKESVIKACKDADERYK